MTLPVLHKMSKNVTLSYSHLDGLIAMSCESDKNWKKEEEKKEFAMNVIVDFPS